MVSLPFPPFTELMPSIDGFSNSLRVFREFYSIPGVTSYDGAVSAIT